MIELITFWLAGFSTGAAFTGGLAGWFRRRKPPYSSAAIAFRAIAEDAAKVRSKIINPLVWEDPPEPMADDGRLDALQRASIKPQFPFAKPTCRVEGRCWPEHLHTDAPFLPAQLTLMGPPNALGAWRWYEAPVSTGHIRIKVDSFLRHLEYRVSG